jgi:ParB family chromosome partitioning protein
MSSRKSPAEISGQVAQVIPTGKLMNLSIDQIIPSHNNPRSLFDAEPLRELKESIGQYGVLVPITAFPRRGQSKFGILDGERRYRCCAELAKEGRDIKIPANIVDPPTQFASLLYMFSIHNFREPWELMPTALSLKTVIEELNEDNNEKLSALTGLSIMQVERCRKLLTFPKRFQDLSLNLDPKRRIPANFWIEAYPVLNLCHDVLPDLYAELGRDEITDRLVTKHWEKKIRSVLHLRRILEAHAISETSEEKEKFAARLREYILDVDLETRRAFDEFVVDSRRVLGAIAACDSFITQLQRSKLEFTADKDEVYASLLRVRSYVEGLLEKLKGGDPPEDEN